MVDPQIRVGVYVGCKAHQVGKPPGSDLHFSDFFLSSMCFAITLMVEYRNPANPACLLGLCFRRVRACLLILLDSYPGRHTPLLSGQVRE